MLHFFIIFILPHLSLSPLHSAPLYLRVSSLFPHSSAHHTPHFILFTSIFTLIHLTITRVFLVLPNFTRGKVWENNEIIPPLFFLPTHPTITGSYIPTSH